MPVDPRLMSFAHLAGLPPVAGGDPDETPDDDRRDDPPADDPQAGEDAKPGKAKNADDEAGDDEDMADDRDDAARAARARERARCAAIFGDKAAGLNPALAASIAFGTALPRSQALNVLRNGAAAAQPREPGLSDRMAGMEHLRTSGAAAPKPGGRQAVDAGWDAAARRAGIPTRS